MSAEYRLFIISDLDIGNKSTNIMSYLYSIVDKDKSYLRLLFIYENLMIVDFNKKYPPTYDFEINELFSDPEFKPAGFNVYYSSDEYCGIYELREKNDR